MKMLLTYALLIVVATLQAQESKKYIREGNEAYKNNKYEDAIAKYERATEADPDDFAGYLNKGDALYNSGQWEEAAQEFLNAMNRARTDEHKAHAWHNLGNVYMEQENYQQSVKAYKEALKLNPADEDTRYNLAYAQSKLDEQQQQNQDDKDSQNKQDNKDEQQDQKKQNEQEQQEQENNQEQQQEKQQEQEENNQQKQGQQDQQQKQEQQGQPQQPQALKKEQAERLLRALEREEEELQEKYNKRKFEIKKGKKPDKDW